VILLPGVVLPANLAYAALRSALGPHVEAVAKDLELYRTAEPPGDYSLALEVEGVLREADALGWERFHLLGYSGGGAAALAVAARRPHRLRTLALLEPAWAGDWDWSREHRALWEEQTRASRLPADRFMAAFMRLAVAPGVTLPPPPAGDPPPWMALRPAGIRAMLGTFATFRLDREALRRFAQPVYLALGGRSNPDQYAEIAERLGRVFPDYRVEVFPDRHHFDPPHRAEPEALARSLRELWDRGD
jgi:pimeloyl-ACP methyl ester carboxylesterase